MAAPAAALRNRRRHNLKQVPAISAAGISGPATPVACPRIFGAGADRRRRRAEGAPPALAGFGVGCPDVPAVNNFYSR